MSQLDLLDYINRPRYPSASGFKQDTTSKAAAARMDRSSWKAWAHKAILDYLALCPSTVKETLAELAISCPDKMSGRDINSLRPRFSELKTMGRIIESGDRRNHEAVWILVSRN
jgi:hypothetical protein